MLGYRFSVTRILHYKDRIVNFALIRENTVNENTHSRIFYAVLFVLKLTLPFSRGLHKIFGVIAK